jgi:hypothetical protein
MAFHFEIHGQTIRCETPEEAARLVLILRQYPRGARPSDFYPEETPLEQRSVLGPVGDAVALTLIKRAHQMGLQAQQTRLVLQAITAAGQVGVRTSELVQVLGLASETALGGALAGIHRCLLRLGFAPDEVFHGVRRKNGRRWIPRHKIAYALALLEGPGMPPANADESEEEGARATK